MRQLVGYITLLQVGSHFNKTFFRWRWLLYVVTYFKEYVCKISVVLDLRPFLVCWFRRSYRGLRQVKTACMPMEALPMSTYRRRLDRLTPDVMCWIPYGDPRSFREFEVISLFSGHLRWGPLTVIPRSERVVGQFGYIQTISLHPPVPSAFVEEMNARWM